MEKSRAWITNRSPPVDSASSLPEATSQSQIPAQYQPPSQLPFTSIPRMLMTETDVRSTQTQMPIFRIEKSAASGSASKKSLMTLVRTNTRLPLGSIRFKSMESSLELSNGDNKFKIKEDGLISFRYYFNTTFAPESKWWWNENDDEGLKLTEGKKGVTIATINSNILIIEQTLGLTEAAIDEVVLTAVAMAEKRRRRKKHNAEGGGIGEIVGVITGF